ncbi:secreted frizzled-related protein 1a [Pygocentrus nattereri]|uniref:Secreted frizzled-related protein 1 n=1 Tax=Pygocentrus nattereri TaxID=42514 RepID=A0AAR2KHE7_PYGNA|nr:secreted frizzled-related protein 1a [Pygocentrus nattereri]
MKLHLCLWKAVAMALMVMSLTSLTQSSEYEYLGWKSDLFNNGRIYDKPPQCVEIPDDLRLCHNVGYRQMLLPNLLEHETMIEVKQQAGSWVPLVHKNCHPSTQVFLCSLFAPVCMDRPIYPCRFLCEEVRDACTPIMEAFGFPWPEMLTCDKFPQGEVCISAPNNTNPSVATGLPKVCPPCDQAVDVDDILEHICASDFVIKTKIKEVKRENLDRKVILQKKKKILKMGTLKKKDMKKLILYLKNGADCPCSQLDNLSNHYLIMGRKVEKQHIITGIYKWDKSSKEFKKTMKKLRSHKCPVFVNVFK